PQTATLIDPPILFRPHVPSGFVWGIMESQHIHQFQEHSGQALKKILEIFKSFSNYQVDSIILWIIAGLHRHAVISRG
ncbi:hypothetical protein, partial [Insolitispirillum peregrinum]|uniref:hypothetical protein n=1 Tax=Insolitispirillum peregrinum TaxID=80876 RepID=UPI00360F8BCD